MKVTRQLQIKELRTGTFPSEFPDALDTSALLQLSLSSPIQLKFSLKYFREPTSGSKVELIDGPSKVIFGSWRNSPSPTKFFGRFFQKLEMSGFYLSSEEKSISTEKSQKAFLGWKNKLLPSKNGGWWKYGDGYLRSNYRGLISIKEKLTLKSSLIDWRPTQWTKQFVSSNVLCLLEPSSDMQFFLQCWVARAPEVWLSLF